MYGKNSLPHPHPHPNHKQNFTPRSHPHPQTKLVNRIHIRNCNTTNLSTAPVTLPAQTFNIKPHPHPTGNNSPALRWN